MTAIEVLLVAGTHGNEINATWLFDQWSKSNNLINTSGVKVSKIFGNPKAISNGSRYVDQDLNRSFSPDLLASSNQSFYELDRSKEILNNFGPNGKKTCKIVLDFHSTTAAMGSCVVVYGRRPSDLALASLLQNKLGLPIYLHELDASQTGFLVEAWPCGLVIEIGPVSQNSLNPDIVLQTKIILEGCLEQIAQVACNKELYPENLIIHRHIKSIDFPRNSDGLIDAVIHPLRIGKDWVRLKKNDPLFLKLNGEEVCFENALSLTPLFINEAAYREKSIAMSMTKREVWNFKKEWEYSLKKLILNSKID